jgi:hypothetical protein
LTKSQIGNLAGRIEKLSRPDVEKVPPWLREVHPDLQDIAECVAIRKSYHGWEFRERWFEFVHKMRAKYPDMPENIDEKIERKGRELVQDRELRRREGITEEMEKEWQD